MRPTRFLLGVLLLAAAWLPSCQPLRAADLVTLVVTVTNTPAQGNSITVNGATRTWVTNVATPATEILIPAGGKGAAASNLWSHAATWEIPTSLVPGMPGTNAVSLRSQLGGTITASLGGTWGTLSLSTNSTAVQMLTVRVPASGEALGVRRFVADQIVDTLNNNATSNAISASAPVAANLVGTSGNQTVAGDKTFSGTTRVPGGIEISNATVTGTVSGGKFAGGVVTNASVHATNGTLTGVTVSGTVGTLTGGTLSGNTISNAALAGTTTGGTLSATTLTNAIVHATNGTLTGVTVSGTVGTLSGGILSGNTVSNATFAGTATGGTFSAPTLNNATINATSGVVSGITVSGTIGALSGGVVSGSTVSNTVASGTTTIADLRLSRASWSPTGGGNSGAVINGSFVNVVDPGSGVFLYGISGGVDGRIIVLVHPGPSNFQIAHDSVSEGTAANRILSPDLSNRTSIGAFCAVLVYDGAASRWRLVSWLD